MVQQIITWTSTFVLMLFLPRYLGPVNYGRIYLAISIAGIFGMIIDYDGRSGVAKRISRSPEGRAGILVNAIGFRVLFWILSFSCMLIFALVSDYPDAVKILLVIFGFEMLWNGARTVIWGMFTGLEKIQYSFIGTITERIFISAVSIAAIFLKANVTVIAIIMISGTLINFLICVRFATRLIPSFPKFDWKKSMILVKEGIPYLLYTIFGFIYYRIDTVMLSFRTPETVVGWYGASYKFFDVLAFLPSIYSISILPILSKLRGKEDDALARTTRKSLEFIILAGIPISLSVIFFSHEIIDFFFGMKGYQPSVLNLQIFSIGLLLIYIDMILSAALIACDKQRLWAVVALTAIFINVALNLFAIPYTQSKFGNGGIGAAIATIITEYFVMVCALLILPKEILGNARSSQTIKALVAGMVMGLTLYFLRMSSIFWIGQIFVGIATYIFMIFLLKTIPPDELDFLKSFISGRSLRAFLASGKEANT